MCSSEIRLLQQRSGLAGYRALPAPLSPLAGAGQGTQGGSTEGPREKERVGRHSTGRLLQDTPVLSLLGNVVTGKPMVRHVAEVPGYRGQHIQWESQSSQQRDAGKGSPECMQNFSPQQNVAKRNRTMFSSFITNLL